MIPAIGAMTAVLAELQSLAGAAVAPRADTLLPDIGGAAGADKPNFAQALHHALGNIDGAIAGADDKAKAFAAGDKDIPLSDVMVSLEQANLSLQLASGVRDKVIGAYTNIMNMQV
jgi:flagellar hook-basal body complex protein FliE